MAADFYTVHASIVGDSEGPQSICVYIQFLNATAS